MHGNIPSNDYFMATAGKLWLYRKGFLKALADLALVSNGAARHESHFRVVLVGFHYAVYVTSMKRRGHGFYGRQYLTFFCVHHFLQHLIGVR